MSAISKLSLRKIQEFVGDGLLKDLNELLKVVQRDFVDGSLYDNKELLEKIFISFGGAEKLADQSFRRELFNHIEPLSLRQMVRTLELPPADKFDENVDSLISVGWVPSDRCRMLLEQLGLPSSLTPRLRFKVKGCERIGAANSRYRPLLDYQSSIYFQSIRKLQVPRSRFVIQMPTGAGKTRTAIEIICSMLNERKCDVVWLAHSGELCEQAVGTFREVWQHVGAIDVNLVRYYGDADKKFSEEGGIPKFIVSSFQSLYSKIVDAKSTLPFLDYTKIGLVVVDEAHKVIAPTYEQVTKKLIGDDTCCIGLTATPGRSIVNLDENKKLAQFFFQEIVSIDSGDLSAIDYLRQKKILAQAEYVPLRTTTSFALTELEKKSLEKFLDLPSGFLLRVGRDVIRNAEIVKRLMSYADVGRKILFFGCSVEHSKFICSSLSYLGIGAAHIDGQTRQELRDHAIEQFRTGEVLVLCNYEVLSTGFDAPKTDVVFISRPTSSLVLYSQMIGRGLRGPLVGGTDSCTIVDVKDNILGFSDHSLTYSYFADFWSKS